MKNVIGLLVAVVAVFAVACGSDTIVPVGTIGETASQAIVATAGGTVELASGVAKLVIPANALGNDLTITVNTLDNAGAVDEAKLASYVFDFGPDGTAFWVPVTLSLKAAAAPKGKKAVLAWLDGDKWTEVAGSSVVDGMVTAEVTHFTKFVVYLKDDKVIIDTVDPICKDLSFSACGGDPVGTWTMETYCLETRVDQVNTNPWEQIPQCAATGNVSYVVDMTWFGEMIINGDGTYTSTVDAAVEMQMDIKDACLSAMTGGAMSASDYCAQLAASFAEDSPDMTYEYKGGVCSIVAPMEDKDPSEPQTGYWAVEGNLLKTAPALENVQANAGIAFCVSGSNMYIQNVDGDDTNDDGTDDVFYHDTMVWKK